MGMREKLVKVIRNGNITIPKNEREKYGISDGDYLEMFDEGDGLKFRLHKLKSDE